MNESPDAGAPCDVLPPVDEGPEEGASDCGGVGIRVARLAVSALRLGRASAASEFVEGVLGLVEPPRLNCGGPESSASCGAADAVGRDTFADVVAESPGLICVPGLLSELPVVRCSLGRSGSSLLIDEALEELLDELSLPLSGFEAARRSAGPPSLPLVEPAADLLEEPPVESLDKGRDVSFVACEAAACSSVVPSLTIVIVEAW